MVGLLPVSSTVMHSKRIKKIISWQCSHDSQLLKMWRWFITHITRLQLLTVAAKTSTIQGHHFLAVRAELVDYLALSSPVLGGVFLYPDRNFDSGSRSGNGTFQQALALGGTLSSMSITCWLGKQPSPLNRSL
ncbi:hypothetical protein CAPTEDRAFT_190135 [Capitella teleta]|uniref:Uncharacterized protein n=1 Tax=Capitella teleta TaxID=283909 RepID=R7UTG5_CAPTE|nr:hypothetical protein CAPTEDRAFT_190135 [Capitella teleta]|eukprot:ELU07212.1 hypothetical protein CAPTEDRAFT_190135 [Capitella teleta]